MAQIPPPQMTQVAPVKKPFPLWAILMIVFGVLLFGFLILVAILYPVFSSAKTHAMKTAGMGNARQTGLGLLMYSADHDGIFPPELETPGDMHRYIDPYTKNSEVYDTHNPNNSVMVPNWGLEGVVEFLIVQPESTVMLSESYPWDDGDRIIVYVDGSAEINDGTSSPNFEVYLYEESDIDDEVLED